MMKALTGSWMVLVVFVGCTSAPNPSPLERMTQVIVPDVVGLTRTEASTAVWNAHLNFVLTCNEGPGCLPDAVVIKQRPQPGTVVSSGTRVMVRMGALVPIPVLVGRTLQQAGNRLDLWTSSCNSSASMAPTFLRRCSRKRLTPAPRSSRAARSTFGSVPRAFSRDSERLGF
jgi:beta-lactam-binding protein with PASTA domain